MYVFGLIGAALVCIGYFLLETKKVKPHSYSYLSLNLAGGICLIISLMSPFQMGNLGPIVLQVIMLGISVYGFFKAAKE